MVFINKMILTAHLLLSTVALLIDELEIEDLGATLNELILLGRSVSEMLAKLEFPALDRREDSSALLSNILSLP